MTEDIKSRLLHIDHGDGGSQWPRNPDGAEAWDCIQGLQNNIAVRCDALAARDAEIERLRAALEAISCPHVTKGMTWWQQDARAALKGGDDGK